MQDQAIANRFWSTASFGEAADTSPVELAALGDHLNACIGERGRWFTLQCLAETLGGFMASRVVTTVTLAAIVVVAGTMVL